jgi:hypothetical protein
MASPDVEAFKTLNRYVVQSTETSKPPSPRFAEIAADLKCDYKGCNVGSPGTPNWAVLKEVF